MTGDAHPALPSRSSREIGMATAGALSSTIRNAGLGPLLIVISLVSVLSLSGAAVTEAWVQRYNGPANSTDGGRALAVDKAGNVVVTGHSNAGVNADEDYYTAKYAGTNGMLLWERRYAGPSNGWDLVYSMTLDNAGNVVVAGITDLKFGTFGAHEGGDYYTANTRPPTVRFFGKDASTVPPMLLIMRTLWRWTAAAM